MMNSLHNLLGNYSRYVDNVGLGRIGEFYFNDLNKAFPLVMKEYIRDRVIEICNDE